MKKDVLKKAFVASVPVLSGYLVIGLSFGVVLQSRGYGPLWSAAMSAFIYAGSMQFVAVELMSSAASLFTVALTTLMVNMRHVFYGLSMVDRYKNTGKARPYLIFALTDETYSLVCNPPEMAPEDEKSFYILVSVLDHVYWILGSFLGSILGAMLPFSTEGIDFALTALFVSVFVEQWLSAKDHVPALMGLVASALCLLIFGADNFLIPSMLLIMLGLTLYRKREEAKA